MSRGLRYLADHCNMTLKQTTNHTSLGFAPSTKNNLAIVCVRMTFICLLNAGYSEHIHSQNDRKFRSTQNGLGNMPKHHTAGLVEGSGSRGRPGWPPELWAAQGVPGPGGGACLFKKKLEARSF